MNSGPLLDAQVEAVAREWVCVRVDSDSRPDLVRLWNVRVLPGMVFLSPEGGLLAEKDRGVVLPADILEFFRRAQGVLDKFRAVQAAAADLPDQPRVQMRYGDRCFDLRLWDRAAEAYERVLASDDAAARPHQESALHQLTYAELARERHEAVLARAGEFEKRFPASSRLPKTAYWRGLALHALGRKEEARAAWESVRTRWPEDPMARAAQEALERAKGQ